MLIPDVQKRMRELASAHGIPELRTLADELSRRKSTRSARISPPMTTELRKAICAYATANPGMSQANIATRFNVNPGRVSEALRGKRQ